MIVDEKDYGILNSFFEENGHIVSLSELHGMMAGFIATQKDPCFKSWTKVIEGVCEWDEIPTEKQTELSNIFLVTNMELVQGIQDMTLVLPNQNSVFRKQLAAFADWCRGFLYGVGSATPSELLFQDQLVKDILSEITQFSQVDLDGDDIEDDVDSLSILLAYLQENVQIIYSKNHDIDKNLNAEH